MVKSTVEFISNYFYQDIMKIFNITIKSNKIHFGALRAKNKLIELKTMAKMKYFIIFANFGLDYVLMISFVSLMLKIGLG